MGDFGLIDWAKKSMKEMDPQVKTYVKSLLGLPGLPKKFLGSVGPPPLWGPGPPHAPFGPIWGVPGPIEEVGPQTPNFFWEVQEVPIDFFSRN